MVRRPRNRLPTDTAETTDADARPGLHTLRHGRSESLAYAANGAGKDRDVQVDPARRVRLKLDLRGWTGQCAVKGGAAATTKAPWRGHDVVLRVSPAR